MGVKTASFPSARNMGLISIFTDIPVWVRPLACALEAAGADVVVAPGGRALPGIPVLLKPTAGGFGKGIVKLGPREDAPDSLFTSTEGWVEQELITAADGIVHRIEILGDRILYEARSPLTPGEYNYCLAHAESSVTLSLAKDLPVTITKPTLRIASTAGMELGAVEYLLDGDGEPVFIDLNPVSSLHPRASDLLGEDPIVMTADYRLSPDVRNPKIDPVAESLGAYEYPWSAGVCRTRGQLRRGEYHPRCGGRPQVTRHNKYPQAPVLFEKHHCPMEPDECDAR